MILDLTRLAGDRQITVLSGKDRGISARADLELAAMDRSDEPVKVIVPDFIKAITPSFVLGLFGESVEAIGSVEGFLQKFQFDTKPHILAQIKRGAQYSLLKGDPFENAAA